MHVTHSICQNAATIVLAAAIKAAELDNRTPCGTIVVLSPHLGENPFILSLPDQSNATKMVAMSKAKKTRELGKPSAELDGHAPHITDPEWQKWGASVIEGSLVVAFCGEDPPSDQDFAAFMLTTIRRLGVKAIEKTHAKSA